MIFHPSTAIKSSTSVRKKYGIIATETSPTRAFYFNQNILNNVEVCEEAEPHSEILPSYEGLIFLRYIPRKWDRFLKSQKKIPKIIFFMDDDLFDLKATKGLPLKYRLRIFRDAWRHKFWLKKNQARLWVSTSYLQQKYKTWSPELVQPSPVFSLDAPVARCIFYHGTASHTKELLWLKPIIEAVLCRNPDVTFECFGDIKIRRFFKEMPRVHVIPYMSWPKYEYWLRLSSGIVGLAPLRDTLFNKARSYTKFFDITAAGAVGIYAKGNVYDAVVRHNVNGLLLSMDKSEWIHAIQVLLDDETFRKNMLENARVTYIKEQNGVL